MRAGSIVVIAITIGLAALGGCGDEAGTSDGAAQCAKLVAPARCILHALGNIDLAGSWTLTGTTTDDHCMRPGMPTTTMPVTYSITLVVEGCTFENTGEIDDTVAISSSTGSQGSSSTTVCVDATGALLYAEANSLRCIPTSGQSDNTTLFGTLTR